MSKPAAKGSLTKATPADYAEMADVIARAIRIVSAQYYESSVIDNLVQRYSTKNLESYLRDKYVLVFKRGDKILGTGVLCGAEVSMVYVDPEVREQGIGRLIMCQLEDEAVKNGVEEVHLDASLGSIEFYEGLQYQRGATGEHFKGLGETVYMHKLLKR